MDEIRHFICDHDGHHDECNSYLFGLLLSAVAAIRYEFSLTRPQWSTFWLQYDRIKEWKSR